MTAFPPLKFGTLCHTFPHSDNAPSLAAEDQVNQNQKPAVGTDVFSP